MKTILHSVAVLTLLVVIGCQKPCTTTDFNVNPFTGDTVFLERTYTICGDTLNYYERKVKKDSTVISEGEILNGKEEGDWVFQNWGKRLITYAKGVEISVKHYDQNGALTLERTLQSDSIYLEKQFYQNGIALLQRFVNMEGYLTGHGIDYDTLGRKSAEGEYIAKPCLTDTVYIESPEPPHDLERTIVTESGGKHGPWVNYDGEGNVTDTTV